MFPNIQKWCKKLNVEKCEFFKMLFLHGIISSVQTENKSNFMPAQDNTTEKKKLLRPLLKFLLSKQVPKDLTE